MSKKLIDFHLYLLLWLIAAVPEFQPVTAAGESGGRFDARGSVASHGQSPNFQPDAVDVRSRAARPHIVWIVADDLSPDLGCYGNNDVRTPHIDRLAQEGAKYTAAFSTAPVCSSSRSALIAGVWQTAIHAHPHRVVHKQPLRQPDAVFASNDKVQLLPTLMRAAGYGVFNVNGTLNRRGKTDYNFEIPSDLYDGKGWPSAEQIDSPCFIQVQIHEPHRPFISRTDPRRGQDAELPPYYPDDPVVRADWGDYLESVEVLDRRVGDVLRRLEQDEMLDNTLIFFFGDHGRPHYRDKQWLYDGGIRVPLIVRHPDKQRAGAVRKKLVSLIDVTAATLAAAGLEVPFWMSGVDFLAEDAVVRSSIFAARDRCGSTLDCIRCVRTDQFKYIRNLMPDRPWSQHSGYKVLSYPGLTVARFLNETNQLHGAPAVFWQTERPAEELYDLSSDPNELRNLAADPRYTATLEKLRDVLDVWQAECRDPLTGPEYRVEETVESSELWYRTQMQKRGFSPAPNAEAYLNWWKQKLNLPPTSRP